MSELLTVSNLEVHFPIRSGLFNQVSGHVRAVDDVSFTLAEGETLGLVGESGAGKTTIGRALLRAIEPTSGQVDFRLNGDVVDIASLDRKELRAFRPNVQLIFQDPYSSLNPRMTVRDIIAEPLVASGLAKHIDVDERVAKVAAMCKLNPEHLRRYPHAFSGGQRQRIGIARALVVDPKFVVADESVSALDVSIQAEILNLLMDLQEQLNLAILFIAHDLSVVAHISDRVAVLYLGQIIELAPAEALFESPRHPYTAALLSAIPDVDPTTRLTPIELEGEIPSYGNVPNGCRFHTRCRYSLPVCEVEQPDYRELEKGHWARCHRSDELSLLEFPQLGTDGREGMTIPEGVGDE
jgi:oligopeptide/dipeptide ABC transporter ATP-binding protein